MTVRQRLHGGGGVPGTGTQLSGVTCTSGTSCIAVGGNNGAPVAEFWDGTNWAQQITGYPNHSSSLSGVSCSSAVCTAVGNVVINGDQQVLVAHWTGTRWYRDTAVAIPPRSSTSYLNGVSCHTWRTCVAVGDFIQPTGAVSLAEHES